MTDSEKPKPPSPVKKTGYEGEPWFEEMKKDQQKQQERSREIIKQQDELREKAKKSS